MTTDAESTLLAGLVLTGALALVGLGFLGAGLGLRGPRERAQGWGLLVAGSLLLPLALLASGFLLIALYGD